jgi:hypothetical protein
MLAARQHCHTRRFTAPARPSQEDWPRDRERPHPPRRADVGAHAGAPVARAEEQLTEQRQVSAVLADLRALVAGLGEQLRGTARPPAWRAWAATSPRCSPSCGCRRPASASASRRCPAGSTSRRRHPRDRRQCRRRQRGAGRTGQRARHRPRRAEHRAGPPHRRGQRAGRLPDALASIQREVSGPARPARPAGRGPHRPGRPHRPHRRPSRPCGPEVGGARLPHGGVATGADVTRTRDSLVAAVTERMDRLEGCLAPGRRPGRADRRLAPAAGAARDADHLGPAPVVERLGGLDGRLARSRSGSAPSGTAWPRSAMPPAGCRPSRATWPGWPARVDALAAVRDDVAAVRTGVTALQDDSALPSLVLGVAALREDVEDLSGRVDAVAVPPVRDHCDGGQPAGHGPAGRRARPPRG